MKDIKAIIFDMDGVIYDTEKVYLDNWISVFDKYGYKMNSETYISVMGTGRKNVKKVFLSKYGNDLPIEEMYKEKDKKLFEEIREYGIPLKKGAIELLDYLNNMGYKIALGTSAKLERVEIQLKSDIREKFQVVVCGDDVEKGKPHPDIFLKAAKKLGVKPCECIVVEDSEAGIKAAYNAGMISIHVEDLKKADDEILKYCHKSFQSLLEIKKYFKENI